MIRLSRNVLTFCFTAHLLAPSKTLTALNAQSKIQGHKLQEL